MIWIFEEDKLVRCFDAYLERYAEEEGGTTEKRDILLEQLFKFLKSAEAEALRMPDRPTKIK